MADQGKIENQEPLRARRGFHVPRWTYPAVAFATLAATEIKTSFLQSKFFKAISSDTEFSLVRGQEKITPPIGTGIYDERLGYTRTAEFINNLESKGYKIEAQARWKSLPMPFVQLYPLFDEKLQAGLTIVDDNNVVLHEARFPRKIYKDFGSVPPLLAHSLLFVEDRELLDMEQVSRNPAMDYKRLVNAVLGYGLGKIGVGGDRSGGSTLATQLEKLRHSPDGITDSPTEKFRQMFMASRRTYQRSNEMGGTLKYRQDVVRDYLNAMPLSSYPRYGEVVGFADGMATWFGVDFDEANKILSGPESRMTVDEIDRKAAIYRQALSLIMAVKKPSDYFLKNRAELEDRVDKFLPLLVQEGLISERLGRAARAQKTKFADPSRLEDRIFKIRQKEIDALRVNLMQTLKVKNLYELDRMDFQLRTTVDARASRAVADTLERMGNPDQAAEAGITGYRLLEADEAGQVIYAFTLMEKTPEGNVVRVQADNMPGHFNLNEASKLELGSTAKLRTMVSYLEAIADLHKRYGADPAALTDTDLGGRDNLTSWVIDYMGQEEADKSLKGILEASLERTYSANPGEAFFSGGGLHRFSNFQREDNGRVLTVRESFHRSVNLPFVRMMRDVVNYTMSQKMNVDMALFEDKSHPERAEYLEKFADTEGKTFLARYWRGLKNKTPEEMASYLAGMTRRTPVALAVIHRSLFPQATVGEMAEFIRREGKGVEPKGGYQKLYDSYAQDKFNLNDRGYLAKVHPLALWAAAYKIANPDAPWTEAVEASRQDRVDIYKWLLESDKMAAQDTRIRMMLEQEAFTHIHKTWKEKGFPFDRMVPSIASALGASGDTPAALAELAGVILNNGVRQPHRMIREVRFGQNTPYEFHTTKEGGASRRVLDENIARIVLREMQGVVEKGTARRAFQSVTLSNGTVLPLGAKTGTGDNRIKNIGAGGVTTSSTVSNRTAAFVFTIDDRFFGTLIAYVPGSDAADHAFTSALPVQVFKAMIPSIRSVLDKSYGVETKSPAALPRPQNP